MARVGQGSAGAETTDYHIACLRKQVTRRG